MPEHQREKILVVEDDPFTRDLLSEELQELGYQTLFLPSGKDAVMTAAKMQAGLVLLDIMMPGLDGFAVCKALRGDERTRRIPVIFITAKGTPQDLTRGLAVGANDYIVKPFNVEVLAARIETQLRTKRLMDRVDKQNEELEILNARIKEFLSMASHDLRTPASVIKLAANTMLEKVAGPLTEMQQSLLEKLCYQTDFMTHLLNDLLNLAHIESGKIVLRKTPEDLNALLKINLSSLSLLAQDKTIALALEPDPALPSVPVDKSRFMEIVDNIVSNAIKFTAAGGKITVKTAQCNGSRDGKWVEISITDTGMGMSPEDLELLFQAFRSAGTKAMRGEKSTGLGLTIAKKLTEMHQGKLEVSSEVGVGTTFVIKLPI